MNPTAERARLCHIDNDGKQNKRIQIHAALVWYHYYSQTISIFFLKKKKHLTEKKTVLRKKE